MRKEETLEMGGGDSPKYHPNLDVRTLPTVDVVGAWENGIPFPDNSFDLVYSSHTLEHIPIRKVEFALLEARRVLKPEGKLVLELPDLEAIIFDTNQRDISEFEIRRLYGDQEYPENFHKGGFSPAYLEKLLHHVGFGKTIENRQGLCFRMIAYKGDIKWLVTDDISYEELMNRHVVLTRDTERNWDGILNRLEAEPESREAAGLMSTLSPTPRLTKFVLENFLEESWDEVYLTHDIVDEEFFNYLRGLFQSDNRITIILNPDLMGVVNAWNQLFASARSKFLFVDSCDFYIHRPIKEPVLNHFYEHEDWAWIAFPREQVKFSSYASALRASTLRQVGYLSEYLNPCVCDDNDLGMKLNSIGKKVLSCAHIEVAHLGRAFQGTCDLMHTMGNALLFRQQRRYVQRWGDQNFFDFSLVPSCTDLEQTPANQFDRVSWTRDRINELIKQDAKIVDIGCGTCPITFEMANCTWVDSDSYEKIAREMKTYGRTIPRDKFVQASADNLPFENKYFEVAIASELLEHMADPIKVLEEIKRVAKHLVLTVPDEYSWDLKYEPFQNPAHVRLYTEEMLKEHLKKAEINHYTFGTLAYQGWAFFTVVADLGEVSTFRH